MRARIEGLGVCTMFAIPSRILVSSSVSVGSISSHPSGYFVLDVLHAPPHMLMTQQRVQYSWLCFMGLCLPLHTPARSHAGSLSKPQTAATGRATGRGEMDTVLMRSRTAEINPSSSHSLGTPAVLHNPADRHSATRTQRIHRARGWSVHLNTSTSTLVVSPSTAG
jgi:hypothetical protein